MLRYALPSVRLFITRVDQSKTIEVGIIKLSRNSNGFPRAEALNKGGCEKTRHFIALNVNIMENGRTNFKANRKLHICAFD